MKFKGFAAKTLLSVIALVIAVTLAIVFSRNILNIILGIISVFAPFILAFILSLLLNPIAQKLHEKFKLPKGLASVLLIVLTIVLLGGVVGGIIWKIISEIKNIYTQLPQITQAIMDWIERVQESFSDIYFSMPVDIRNVLDTIGDNIQESLTHIINDNYRPVVHGAGNVAKKLPSIFVAIIVFILSLFFMVSGRGSADSLIKKVIPQRVVDKTKTVFKEIKKTLGGYVKAQLIIMSVAFVIIITGLSIIKIEYALLIAVGIAILDALPFFGSGAVLIPWALISFINTEFKLGVGLIIIYLLVIFTRQMIEPKIVSSKIGINPLITLMSMYVGYRIFSFGGMILGPVVLVFVMSLYKAGVLEPFKKFFKKIYVKIKEELK